MSRINSKVAVTGADGQLGFEICQQLGDRAVPLYEHEMDIACSESVRATLRALRPDVLINTAAYTDVDGAESNADLCSAVNILGTQHLATSCQELRAKFVQISTDYVFSGEPNRAVPFREEDPPEPQGIYARSKLASEQAAQACANHLIVRTCGLHVNRDDDKVRNFAKTMLRLVKEHSTLRVVNDQYCTPSYAPHVARGIVHAMELHQGVLHIVNSGSTTWHGFAVELFRQAGIAAQVEPISSADYAMAAKRPRYSVLDNSKYLSLGGPSMPSREEGISDFLAQRRTV